MKYQQIGENFYGVLLEVGEDCIQDLAKLVHQEHWGAGAIHGIGAVRNVVLGYFSPERQSYLRQEFGGHYELVSCQGNFSWYDGRPLVHLHATIADEKSQTYGGHLLAATISIAGEFFFRSSTIQWHREKVGELYRLTF